MAYALVYVFDGVGVTESQYWAVNEKLGIDEKGNGPWPEGLISHGGGPTAGGWLVTEIWTSKAAQEQFMASRLGPALGAVGVAAPTQLIESELVHHQLPG